MARRKASGETKPYWHLVLGLPASRVVRKYISVVILSGGGILLWQPEHTDTVTFWCSLHALSHLINAVE